MPEASRKAGSRASLCRLLRSSVKGTPLSLSVPSMARCPKWCVMSALMMLV